MDEFECCDYCGSGVIEGYLESPDGHWGCAQLELVYYCSNDDCKEEDEPRCDDCGVYACKLGDELVAEGKNLYCMECYVLGQEEAA